MPKKETITCDYCGEDLTNVGPRYRLKLTAETTSSTLSVMVYPPVKEPAYFCGLVCLLEWADKKASLKR